MNDNNSAQNPFLNSFQNNNQNQDSYVDSYQPPTSQYSNPATPPATGWQPPVAPPSPMPPQMQADEPFSAPVPQSRFQVEPPAQAEPQFQPQPAPQAQSQSQSVSQTLEDQNIFNLLGVDGSDEEKESFLDELQQVIWEDFLDRDVELLITEEEMNGLKTILAKKEVSPEQQQEEVLVYLDKLVPDLEAIMLEKALELKEDMVRERLAGMKEFHGGNQEIMEKLTQAEELMNDAQWRDAAALLNGIK